jgi:MFS family permease
MWRAPAGYRATLRQPVAVRLLSAQLVSEAGDFVGLAALVLLSYHASGTALGPALVLASRALPALGVATLLGRWLDRPPRRTVLIAAHLTGAVAIGICAAAPGTATAAVAAALLGATRAAYKSVQAAAIAESVPGDLRLALFGLSGTINMVDQVVGVFTGAVLTLSMGARTSLLIDLASFLIAATILTGLPTGEQIERPRRPGPLDGLRIIARDPVLGRLSVLVLATAFVSSLSEALPPAYVSRAWLPFVLAAAPAGGGVFIFSLARTGFLRRVRNQARVAAALAAALLLTALAVAVHAPSLLFALANASIGACFGWLTGAQATFATRAPRESLGQIEATLVAGIATAGGAGVLLCGALATATTPALGYAAPGVLLTVVLAVVTPRLLRAETSEPEVAVSPAPATTATSDPPPRPTHPASLADRG